MTKKPTKHFEDSDFAVPSKRSPYWLEPDIETPHMHSMMDGTTTTHTHPYSLEKRHIHRRTHNVPVYDLRNLETAPMGLSFPIPLPAHDITDPAASLNGPLQHLVVGPKEDTEWYTTQT